MNAQQASDWQAVKPGGENHAAAANTPDPQVEKHRLEQVFRERARKFATRSTAAAPIAHSGTALAFSAGGERFCIAATSVVEVLHYVRCSPIPGARPELLGVLNVRGHIRAVLDLALVLDLPPRDEPGRGYIVLVRHDGAEVGLCVDEVEQLESLASDPLVEPREDLQALTGGYIRDQTAGGAAVLDLPAIFSHPVFSTRRDGATRVSAQRNHGKPATSDTARQRHDLTTHGAPATRESSGPSTEMR